MPNHPLISKLHSAHFRLLHQYNLLHPLQLTIKQLALQERIHSLAFSASTQTLKIASESRKDQLQSLLSRCVQDIIDPSMSIVLLDEAPKASSNSKNQLHYFVLKGNSQTPLHANGGAIHNVITTALRIVATFYSSQRRLLVLDEPDCWIAPENIKNYFQTLTHLGTSGNFQTLIISHHHPENFDPESSTIHSLSRVTLPLNASTSKNPTLLHAYNHLLDHGSPPQNCPFNLDNNQNFYSIQCTSNPPHALWPNPAAQGIRAIELVNFREHAHTKIPLSPGVNILQGPNNVGKSAALRAAFQALFDSNQIGPSDVRTSSSSALIRLYIENNTTIELSRQSGRPKTCMWHISNTHSPPNPLLNRFAAKDPNSRVASSEEVFSLLNIDPDIQIQDQFDGATFNFKSRSDSSPHSTLHQRGPLFDKLSLFRKNTEATLKSIKNQQATSTKQWASIASSLQNLAHLFSPTLPILDNPSSPLPQSSPTLLNTASQLQNLLDQALNLENRIQHLNASISQLHSLQTPLQHLSHISALTNTPPLLASLQLSLSNLYDRSAHLQALLPSLSSHTTLSLCTQPLAFLPPLLARIQKTHALSLETHALSIQQKTNLHHLGLSLSTFQQLLPLSPSLKKLASTPHTISSMRTRSLSLESKYSDLQSLIAPLSLPPLPPTHHIRLQTILLLIPPMTQKLETCLHAGRDLSATQKNLSSSMTAFSAAQHSWNQIKLQHPHCPTCSTPLSSPHTHN